MISQTEVLTQLGSRGTLVQLQPKPLVLGHTCLSRDVVNVELGNCESVVATDWLVDLVNAIDREGQERYQIPVSYNVISLREQQRATIVV